MQMLKETTCEILAKCSMSFTRHYTKKEKDSMVANSYEWRNLKEEEKLVGNR